MRELRHTDLLFIGMIALLYVGLSMLSTVLAQLFSVTNLVEKVIIFQIITLAPVGYVLNSSVPNINNSPIIELSTKAIAKFTLGTLLLSTFSARVSNLIFGTAELNRGLDFDSRSASAFISIVILGPILEEYLFRRGLYGYLHKKTTPILALVFTSVVFCLSHLPLQYSIALVGISFGLTYLYHRTKSLKSVTIVHMIINFLAWLNFGRQPTEGFIPDQEPLLVVFSTLVFSVFAFLGFRLLRTSTDLIG